MFFVDKNNQIPNQNRPVWLGERDVWAREALQDQRVRVRQSSYFHQEIVYVVYDDSILKQAHTMQIHNVQGAWESRYGREC